MMEDDYEPRPSPEAARLRRRIEATREDLDALANEAGTREAADTANTLHRLLTHAEQVVDGHGSVMRDSAGRDVCRRCSDRDPCYRLTGLARVWPEA